jgi:DNA-binding Lrp family transcriptional regulator
LDDLDRRLLNLVQEDFPIDERPYLVLAKRLGCDEREIIDRLTNLVAAGVIRHLSPVFDLRKLGYCSTLAALNVPTERVDEVAAAVNRHPEVTHNYLRDAEPNVWFTVIAESQAALSDKLEEIEREANSGPVQFFPARRMFRARVVFDFAEEQNAG